MSSQTSEERRQTFTPILEQMNAVPPWRTPALLNRTPQHCCLLILQEEGRRPATLTVKWRLAHGSYQRSSASCPMPPPVLGRGIPAEQQIAALAAAALGLLRRNLREPFDLSLINIGASGFSEGAAAAAAGTRDIASMLGGGGQAGSAAAGAAGQPAAREQQQQQPQQQQLGHLPWLGKAAAAASAEQRRHYSAAPQQAPLLSKMQERQLREQPQQPQQPQQSQQAPRGGDEWGFRDGWGEELQQEEAEDDFWGDLQSLQEPWQSGNVGGNKRQPSPTAQPLAAGQPSGSGGRPQAQHGQPQLQTAAAGKPPAGASGGGSTAAAGMAGGGSGSGGRVVLHCDVDSFYVAVRPLFRSRGGDELAWPVRYQRTYARRQAEQLGGPSLRGVPLSQRAQALPTRCRWSGWTIPRCAACRWLCSSSTAAALWRFPTRSEQLAVVPRLVCRAIVNVLCFGILRDSSRRQACALPLPRPAGTRGWHSVRGWRGGGGAGSHPPPCTHAGRFTDRVYPILQLLCRLWGIPGLLEECRRSPVQLAPRTARHPLAFTCPPASPNICLAQAASIEECKRRCPGLVVRPMRTDRYREASEGLSCASHIHHDAEEAACMLGNGASKSHVQRGAPTQPHRRARF